MEAGARGGGGWGVRGRWYAEVLRWSFSGNGTWPDAELNARSGFAKGEQNGKYM